MSISNPRRHERGPLEDEIRWAPQAELAFLIDEPRRLDEQAALKGVTKEQTASLQTALLHGREGRVVLQHSHRPGRRPPAAMKILHTSRLRLEPFAEHHLEGLHAMNRLAEVARYLSGQPETREQTAEAIARARKCWAAWGTSWWALIELESGRVAGAGCVQHLRKELVMPTDLSSLCANPLEFGWRLHPDFWHRGLATEAAVAMAKFAFERFPIAELLAVRRPENDASARVMERMGMQYRGLEPWYGTAVATHVLSREAWQRAGDGAREV